MFTSQKNYSKQKWDKKKQNNLSDNPSVEDEFQINTIVSLNKKSRSYNKLSLDHDHVCAK